MTDLNVAEIQIERVEHAATDVWGWDEHSWEVKCETPGCVNTLRVPKRTWHPVDPADRRNDAPMIEVQYNRPGRRHCAECGFRNRFGVTSSIPRPVVVFRAQRVHAERGVHMEACVRETPGGQYHVHFGGWRIAVLRTESGAIARALKELASS